MLRILATILDLFRGPTDEPFQQLYKPEEEEYVPPANTTYDEPVVFTKTNQFGNQGPDEDDVYTVEEFIACVKSGAFIDYDGYGHPVKDNLANTFIYVRPSKLDKIPKDATHIVWYNR